MFKSIRQFAANKLSPERKKKIISALDIFKKKFSKIGWFFRKRNSDIVLISFPKSGRTWLNVMIGRAIKLHFNLKEEKTMDLYKLAAFRPQIPKIIMIHNVKPADRSPGELVELSEIFKKKKIIFLVRDPRDLIVSVYFQKKKRNETYDGELSDFLYQDVGSIDTIIKYYHMIAESMDSDNGFLLVRYEDIHENAERELRRVLEFIGIKAINDSNLTKSVEYGAFNNMRKMEEADTFKTFALRPKNKDDQESYKTRKGKVGGYVDYLQPEEIEYLNRKIDKNLSNIFGYNT